MIGVKFFAVMARFPDPPVTEASAFQVSAPANRIAAVAASMSMSMSLRIVSSRFLSIERRKLSLARRKKQLCRVPQGSTAGVMICSSHKESVFGNTKGPAEVTT
jgi:hypothetical protein